MDAGGYQLDSPTGTYNVTFSGAGIAPTTRQVTIGAKNVKFDLVDPAAGGSAQPVPQPTPEPKPPAPSTISGTAGNDNLYGTSGDDAIQGLGGNDKLNGQAGNHHLNGGAGRDILNGGAGNDRLVGGADADTFVFRGAFGADRIDDFQHHFDRIDMRSNGRSFAKLHMGHADVDGDGLPDDSLIHVGSQSVGILNASIATLDRGDFLP